MTPYGNGTFNPAGKVTNEELATFLVRGLGLESGVEKDPVIEDSSVSGWAQGYVALALEKKIMSNEKDGEFGGTKNATRESLVISAYEAKQVYEASATPLEPSVSPSPTPTPSASPSPESTQTPTPTPEPTATPRAGANQ